MNIDPKTIKPMVKARKPRPREGQEKPREKSEFEKACEAAKLSPGTVRRRMAPKHERGQGMTLEEALSTPAKSRSECGTARRAKTSWGLFDGDKS